MPPVRRYLRITEYTVLECRIYLDDPSLVDAWLLHPRNPALPRVFESVRPLVVPKLMEERERARTKTSKKRGAIRDVVVEDDFEVALFLTETNTRHSVLFKHRHARDKTQTRLVSNASRLTGGGEGGVPIDLDADAGSSSNLRIDLSGDGEDAGDGDEEIVLTGRQAGEQPPRLLREEDDNEEVVLPLASIPDIRTTSQRPKRRRSQQKAISIRDSDGDDDEENDNDNDNINEDDDDQESLFASGDESDTDDAPSAKRVRIAASASAADDDADAPKKKITIDVLYEGFAIYGRVLCLVVKYRGRGGVPGGGVGAVAARSRTLESMMAAGTAAAEPAEPATPGGFAVMENWLASMQTPEGYDEDDEGDDADADANADAERTGD